MAKMQQVLFILEDYVHSDTLMLCMTLVKMLLLLAIALHLSTCCWYAIGTSALGNWTSDFDTSNHSWEFWYFSSARWMLAQLNGKTDTDVNRTTVEMAYTCLVAVVFAVLVMAVFVSTITKTLLELARVTDGRTHARILVHRYLNGHCDKINAEVATRVQRSASKAMVADHKLQEFECEAEVMKLIPKQIQNELLHAVRKPILIQYPFFQHLDVLHPAVLVCICCKGVQLQVCHRADAVFEYGDPCNCMWFVAAGELKYSLTENTNSVHSQFLATDEEGSGEEVLAGMWISEAALWVSWYNRGALHASRSSALLCLDVSDFQQALKAFRDVHAAAALYAMKFVKALQNRDTISDMLEVLVTEG